jgi:hypothetical protein
MSDRCILDVDQGGGEVCRVEWVGSEEPAEKTRNLCPGASAASSDTMARILNIHNAIDSDLGPRMPSDAL